jgi:hypothetical protein
VERELRAQVDRALEAGIDVTHLDSHMATALEPEFADVYAQLAFDYRLPVFLPRVDRAVLEALGLADRYEVYARLVDRAKEAGLPVFDHFNIDSLSFSPGTGAEHNARRLAGLGPGVSWLLIHAAQGGPELESITEDWRQRDEERRIYSDGTMERTFSKTGVTRIGLRPLRDLVRS